MDENKIVIALAGNPNVGKSTVFNALTGLNQHTGNWAGKTVTNAVGDCEFEGHSYSFVDLPGTYSLMALSAEEEVARDFICSGKASAVVVVCDATCLERNLNLVIQILGITKRVVVCINLLDEAEKKGIIIDTILLEEKLGVPIVPVIARSKKGLDVLMKAIFYVAANCNLNQPIPPTDTTSDEHITSIIREAEQIASDVVTFKRENYYERDRKIDKIVTHKFWGVPIMLALLGVVFWITLQGANYPSQLLMSGLFWVGDRLMDFCKYLNAPWWLSGALVDGVYKVLAWVIAVMLPPMAIFFPLFTLLEDLGYLPRVAFNLDRYFKKANACGKQALTMCMGFGCNAAGVVGCRIIDSPRERLIAIITNCFVPCNGRFPTIITVISMFTASLALSPLKQSIVSTAYLLAVVLLGILMTFFVSWLLSKTLLKGVPSSFTLELPPYRRPQVGKILIRSLLDRTLFVLGRAVAIAAPSGLIIWILANTIVGEMSLLAHVSSFLDPFGRLIGLDGVIVFAFILGFSANEIVVPIIIMTYMSQGTILDLSNTAELQNLLINNGWTIVTAICMVIFMLFHFPCSTTCLSIKKESGSFKWTAVSFILPTLIGIIICFVINMLTGTIGRLGL